eukprot:39988-Ditylum_brightwellii.AAC.1
MKEAAEHVPFQLPNEFTRIGFLLAGITSSNAGLQARMANTKSDADLASETSKRHHFELAANFFQPFCPVLMKFSSGTKCDAIKISDVSGSKYEVLTQPQTDKLQEWQEEKSKSTNRGREGRGKSPDRKQENYKQGRAIATSVLKNMKAISKQRGKVEELNLPNALIMSLFEDKDVKKAIRASVPSVEVAVKV